MNVKSTSLLVFLTSFTPSLLHATPVKLYGTDKISKLAHYKQGEYIIQAGAFNQQINARRLADKLKHQFNYPVLIEKNSRHQYVVLVGPVSFNKVVPTKPVAQKHLPESLAPKPKAQLTPETYIPSPTADWTPRATSQGLFGGEEQAGGFFDAMVPLWGMQDKLLYVDGSIMVGNSNRQTYSIGAGYRGIYDGFITPAIYGVFGFADWYQSQYNKQVWLANPGFEWMTSKYELRAQGYFTLSERSQNLYQTLASELPARFQEDSGRANIYSYAAGHSLFDAQIYLTQEFGNGFEAEGGIYFPWLRGGWLRAGGYGFQYKHARSVQGVEANLQFFLNQNASIILQDNYDNQNHNRFSIGFQMNFGGPDITRPQQLSNRMEEPIIRHNARQSYGEAIPTRLGYKLAYDANGAGGGNPIIVYNNVWFFSNSAGTPPATLSLANCTAESPCGTPTQATIDQINAFAIAPTAYLVFGTGTYNLYGQPAFLTINYLNLHDKQIVWGRSSDYKYKVTGNNRPLFNGSLFWGNDGMAITAEGAIKDIRVTSNQIITNAISGYGANAVIPVGATGTLLVDGSDIYSARADLAPVDAIGVYSSGLATVYNSNINIRNQVNSGALKSIGVKANNIISSHNTITTYAFSFDNTSNSNNLEATNVISTSDNLNSEGSTISGFGSAVNILATNAVVLNSQLLATSQSGSANHEMINISATGDLALNNSQLAVTGSAGSGLLQGYNIKGATYAVVNNSQLSASISSIDGNVEITGISATNAIVNGSFINIDTNVTLADTTVKGITATNDSAVDRSIITINTSANSGSTLLTAIESGNNGYVYNSSISIDSDSNQGNITLKAVNSSGNNIVSATGINITSKTNGGTLSAIGVESTNNSEVSNSTISIETVSNVLSGGSDNVIGVKGSSGTVSGSVITVSAKTSAVKCQGVTSPDGSCS